MMLQQQHLFPHKVLLSFFRVCSGSKEQKHQRSVIYSACFAHMRMHIVIFTPLCFPDEIHGYEDEIDAELQTSRPKLRGVYAAYAKQGTEQRV